MGRELPGALRFAPAPRLEPATVFVFVALPVAFVFVPAIIFFLVARGAAFFAPAPFLFAIGVFPMSTTLRSRDDIS